MSTRARRTGEPVTETTAAKLAADRDAFLRRIVQTPGHRGVLRGAWEDEDGLVAVCTTTGIAHYEPTTPFLVWGP